MDEERNNIENEELDLSNDEIDDDYKVMELELVEPQLFLGFRKTKKELTNFAKAIKKKI